MLCQLSVFLGLYCTAVQGMCLLLIIGFKARNVNYKVVSIIVRQLVIHLLNRPYICSSLPGTFPRASIFLALHYHQFWETRLSFDEADAVINK